MIQGQYEAVLELIQSDEARLDLVWSYFIPSTKKEKEAPFMRLSYQIRTNRHEKRFDCIVKMIV